MYGVEERGVAGYGDEDQPACIRGWRPEGLRAQGERREVRQIEAGRRREMAGDEGREVLRLRHRDATREMMH